MIILDMKPEVVRSPHWQTFRKNFIKGKACEVCGSKTKLEVHHIIPVHVDPAGELVPENCMVLCESKKTLMCHLIIGHLGSYFSINPTAKQDAIYWARKFKERTNV